MALPWVRLDTGIPDNPKILALMGAKKSRAVLAYVFALAYSGRHETDGFIPSAALPFIHASRPDAQALCEAGLWHARPGGWVINDWADYQPTSEATTAARDSMKAGSKRGNCKRWHGPECDCWKQTPASPTRIA